MTSVASPMPGTPSQPVFSRAHPCSQPCRHAGRRAHCHGAAFPRFLLRLLAILAVILVVLPTGAPPAYAADGDTVVSFPDENLERAIRNALGISESEGDITVADMETLTNLNLLRRLLTDLTGLEHATNLVTLNLDYNNNLANISALGSLTNLEELKLGTEQPVDLSALALLENLKSLDLRYIPADELGFLTSLTALETFKIHDMLGVDGSALAELPNLKNLEIFDSSFVDMAFMADLTQLTFIKFLQYQGDLGHLQAISHLENLEELMLYTLELDDVSFVAGLENLTYVEISSLPNLSDLSPFENLTGITLFGAASCAISDISPLAGMTELTYLRLDENRITDISALAGMEKLERLLLDTNEIEDISALSGKPHLRELDISWNKVADVSSLSGKSALQALHLAHNRIEDISAIADSDDLRNVTLNHNQITDISALAGNENIRTLRIDHNRIADISALSEARLLIELYASNNRIESIEPLSDIDALEIAYLDGNEIDQLIPVSPDNLITLYIGSNPLTSADTLAQQTVLRELDISHCQLASLAALAGLAQLHTLDASFNQIADISPLAEVPTLEVVMLNGNAIGQLEPLASLPSLERLELCHNALTDVSALADCDAVEELWIAHNAIVDLAPLAGMDNLEVLDISGNAVADLRPLADAPALAHLIANDNAIADITPLADYAQLERVELLFNAIDLYPAGMNYTAFRDLKHSGMTIYPYFNYAQEAAAFTASDGVHPEIIELRWDRVPEAESYTLYRTTSSSYESPEKIAEGITLNRFTDYHFSSTRFKQYYRLEAVMPDGTTQAFHDSGYAAHPRAYGNAANPDKGFFSWGGQDFGQSFPSYDLAEAQDISLGLYHGIGVLADGNYVSWGDSSLNQRSSLHRSGKPFDAGYLSNAYLNYINQVSSAGDLIKRQNDIHNLEQRWLHYSGIAQIAGGGAHSLFLYDNGYAFSMGNNTSGQCDIPADVAPIVSVAAGGEHSLLLTDEGEIIAFGDNSHGQCAVPEDIGPAAAIGAGMFHSVALLEDGSVVCWGDNTFGQCDTPASLQAASAGRPGPRDSHALPVKLDVAAFNNGMLFDDGSVVLWGNNDWSQAEVPGDLEHADDLFIGGTHAIILGESDPVQSLWATCLWFGSFAGDNAPTLWSYDLGWITSESDSIHDMRFWSSGALGWFWSRDGVYPWVWSWDRDTWLYCYGGEGDGEGAWFYNLAAEENQWLN